MPKKKLAYSTDTCVWEDKHGGSPSSSSDYECREIARREGNKKSQHDTITKTPPHNNQKQGQNKKKSLESKIYLLEYNNILGYPG